jgi:hypothetical protein
MSLVSQKSSSAFVDRKKQPRNERKRMPSVARQRSVTLSIPMRIVETAAESRDGSDDEEACYICTNEFCDDDDCCRSLTHLACCTQTICCACLLKSAKQCKCKDDCDAVISLCPFCREVSAVDALDIFLATKPPCKDCRLQDEKTATVATPPTPDAPPPPPTPDAPPPPPEATPTD